mmetsp:Transcript_26840/g.79696  ORF Transcript_26840/g.79696 Transcript_26840/m.79696 type:complete len:309 (-) Transcript_26840:417-1343(-)
MHAQVLRQLAEEQPEEAGQQRAAQVEPLVGVVVTIVLSAALEHHQHQPVHHVAHEKGLFGLGVLAQPDVRQQLLLQDLARVLDALGARDADRGAALADVVERDLGALHRLRLLNAWAQPVHHVGVPKVVHNVLQDLLVCLKAECAEEDEDGDVRLDVRDLRTDHACSAARAALLVAARQHLDRHGARVARRVLKHRPDLCNVRVLGRLALLEHIHVVVGHALLGDEHLLRAVDDKVAARVVRILPKLCQLLVCVLVQGAEKRAQHDGYLCQENLLILLLLLLRLAFWSLRDLRSCKIDVHGRRIRQIP